MMTTEQAAKELGVTPRRIRALIQAGRLPAQRITDRMYLINPKHLDKVRNRRRGRPKKTQ